MTYFLLEKIPLPVILFQENRLMNLVLEKYRRCAVKKEENSRHFVPVDEARLYCRRKMR